MLFLADMTHLQLVQKTVHYQYEQQLVFYYQSEIAEEIKKHIPDFTITYKPDFRQKIADSWPASIDDSSARSDWKWKHQFEMDSMTEVMLENLKKQILM